jgi:nicotinamide-nucleotide amidase
MSAALLVEKLKSKAWSITTAESCTGGLLAADITSVAGASDVFHSGYVTYANAAKSTMLGVSAALIAKHGAVSEVVARAMAEGALEQSGANVAVAITGIAGPAGGSADKPVGLVHFSCATAQKTIHVEMRYGNIGRDTIRKAAVATALQLAMDAV